MRECVCVCEWSVNFQNGKAATMEETIERTERVVETLRQVALAATEDPNVSQQNLPEKL